MAATSDPIARGERRRARTRAAILDAAEQLAAERSIEAIRIEDVAAAAGVSPASVYVHFRTKDGLVAAVVDRLLMIATETLEAAYNADLQPFDRFVGVGIAYLDLILNHPAILKYLAATGDVPPSSDHERLANSRLTALRERFERRIQEAIDAGQLRPLDPRLMSYFLMGAWNGVAALALRKDGLALPAADVERAVLQAADALQAGLVTQ